MPTLDSVSGAGLLVDQEYTIRDGNERCVVVFEEPLAWLLGQSLQTLADRSICEPRCLDRWKRAVDQVAGGGVDEVTDQVTLQPSDDGDEYVYTLTVRPATADGGAAVCSLQNAGTQRGYEETLTALHEATRELLTVDSVEEVLHETAVAAGEVLGFPGTGVRRYNPESGTLEHVSLGTRVEDIESRPSYPVEGSPHGTALMAQETLIEEIGREDPYDREVFSQTMYVPIGTEGLLSVGTLGGSFDDSDVQFAELLAENAAAAIRVIQTTESLRQERQQLELLRQILSRVLRHNIRNDMSVVKSSAEVIDQRTDERTDEYLTQIHESVESVTSLSRKARQIGQIIDKPDAKREIDLSDLLAHVVEQMTLEYPGLTVETTIEQPCRVSAHTALGLAVRNLLENTAEHTACESITAEILVTVEDETVALVVQDDGPGIPPEEIDVLEMEAETALDHGSGLGLWIVKWVVEQSEGTIEFCSDDGACIELRLPRV
jgi:signal transduction histidine kinase